jgi:hypothetical protein
MSIQLGPLLPMGLLLVVVFGTSNVMMNGTFGTAAFPIFVLGLTYKPMLLMVFQSGPVVSCTGVKLLPSCPELPFHSAAQALSPVKI